MQPITDWANARSSFSLQKFSCEYVNDETRDYYANGSRLSSRIASDGTAGATTTMPRSIWRWKSISDCWSETKSTHGLKITVNRAVRKHVSAPLRTALLLVEYLYISCFISGIFLLVLFYTLQFPAWYQPALVLDVFLKKTCQVQSIKATYMHESCIRRLPLK
jgi:hypothetical protein